MKTKKIIAIIALMLGIVLALNTNVFALQSTSTGTSKIDAATYWITTIRKIEGENGGMGLKETINTTTLVPTSESNNIDVHLQKNTEYGAMILLGASNYGKRATNTSATSCWMQSGVTSITGTSTTLATSTGNISGVYELGYYNMNRASYGWEWTAGGGRSFLSSIDSRYRNIYTTATSSALAGDATVDGDINLSTWHTSRPNSNWPSAPYGFMRGGGDRGVFSRSSNFGSDGSYARAAVVCGAGL